MGDEQKKTFVIARGYVDGPEWTLFAEIEALMGYPFGNPERIVEYLDVIKDLKTWA